MPTQPDRSTALSKLGSPRPADPRSYRDHGVKETMAASNITQLDRANPGVSRTAIRDDSGLLAAVAGGDHEALGELYDRFGRVAYGLAIRVLRDHGLAEDAVADAFLSVWRSAGRFDARRGSAKNWILTLVHRRAVDLVQRSERQHRVEEAVVERSEASAADTAELNDERARVQKALAALPAKQRAALELSYYAGYTQAQIALELDLPVGTVKSQVFNGLKRLAQLLGEPVEMRPTG